MLLKEFIFMFFKTIILIETANLYYIVSYVYFEDPLFCSP